MKNQLILFFCCLLCLAEARTQDKYFTKQGHIAFDATGGMEKIEAVNNSGICVLDTKTGALQLAVLLKGFEFEKALMQEHFNENYVESDKFPKAEFKGELLNNNDVTYKKNGAYEVRVKGTLTLHGVSKEVSATGKLFVKDGKIQANASFDILFSDFHISIPSLVKDKVSDHATIRVDCLLEPLKS